MSLTINDHIPQSESSLARSAAVVCESTCCLPAELVRRYDLGILPIPYVFGTETYRDGVDLTHAQFYEKLAATQTPPKTSPPAPGEYLEAWRAASRRAPNVISVTVDSKISTLQRSARLARDLSDELLPGVSVAVVDSLSAGMGQGFVALAAARAVEAGASFMEAVARAEDVSRRVHLFVTLDTLDYLAKASRIPQVAAFLGGVLAIKPIIEIAGGDIRPIARVRSRRRSIDALFEQVRAAIPPGARVHLAVQHARADAEALALEARLRDTFDCREAYTTEFTPIMGGYCGPGLLGVAFYCEADSDEA